SSRGAAADREAWLLAAQGRARGRGGRATGQIAVLRACAETAVIPSVSEGTVWVGGARCTTTHTGPSPSSRLRMTALQHVAFSPSAAHSEIPRRLRGSG